VKRFPFGPAAGLLVLALVVVVALFGGTSARPGSEFEGSIDSAAPGGRRALALVARRLAFPAEGWRNVPAALPRGPHALLLARPPERERIFPEPGPRTERVGMHDLEHYAEFVRAGGTIVAAGEEGLAFVVEELALEESFGLELEPCDGSGPTEVLLATGERLRVHVPRAFAPLDASFAARPWASLATPLGEERAFAVEVPEGAGRVLLLADGAFLDNARLGADDHPVLAVRLLEHALRGGRLLLDEYALGLWTPDGALDVATRPELFLFTLHALALALLWGWMRAAPRAFPRDPEPLDAFSPLLRARAQARLCERARQFELLAAPLREAALARLCRRARLRQRPGLPAEAQLARLAPALGEEVAARERELLARPVRSRAALARLAADAAALAREGGA
jgi:hypothetical protein